MMHLTRNLLCFAALLSPAAASAQALDVGADVALLMREEGSGQRTPLASVGPRVNWSLHRNIELSALYRYSYVLQGDSVQARTQYHRFALRPEWHLPLRAVDWVVAAGPLAEHAQTRFFDGDVKGPHAGRSAFGAMAGTALDFRFAAWTFRAGVDALLFRNRQDISFSLGGTYGWGGAK